MDFDSTSWKLGATSLALHAQPRIFFVVRSVNSHLVAAYRHRLSPLHVAAQSTAASPPLSSVSWIRVFSDMRGIIIVVWYTDDNYYTKKRRKGLQCQNIR